MSEKGGGTFGGSSGIESNPRRCSDPTRPKTEEESRQEAGSEAATPSLQTKEQQPQFPQVIAPRHINTRTASPPNGRLSRNPSSASTTGGEGTENESKYRSFRQQRLEPPVTKATLSELDVNKIIHNPKLRHDINFDPELHFRPNLDGEKGRRKQDKANQFWAALLEQLYQFAVDRPAFFEKYGESDDWCLPLLLKAVKEIIQTLVPARDRLYLEEGLNVELLMQQFNKGIADLEKMASWLSGVLKSHCAPMRDEWVDEMYNQLSNGNRTNNMEELVAGMRSLLCVLEAMKLDVANHQIRCLRPILIEDTVHFEQRFFEKKIRTGKLNPAVAQSWYHQAEQEFSGSDASAQSFGEMATFFEAISKLVLPSMPLDNVPNTFLFDEERILKLRADMLDAINLEICMRLYERLEKGDSMETLNARFAYDSAEDLLAPQNFNFNAVSSRPASLVFSASGSANSSPRNSGIFSSSSPPSRPSSVDSRKKSQDLYQSLVALLQTAPAASRQALRWKSMKDSLALQIFRFTGAPGEYLSQLEEELEFHLSEPASVLYREVEQHFHRRLLTELGQRVKEFKALSGVSLFSVATGGRLQGPGRTWDGNRDKGSSDNSNRDGREEGGVEDMATRLAHLGIMHWRVWAQLVYVPDMDGDISMDTDDAE